VNGSGGAIYNSIILPSASLAPGDYYVVCANAATVPNCDLDDSPNTNFIQNGAPDAVGLRFNGALIDAVSYEGDTVAPYTEGSGTGLSDAGADGSISRCDDGTDTNQNNVDLTFTSVITPGAANACPGAAPPFGMCADPATLIHDVQGSGLSSPIDGAPGIVLEAVVVGDFQGSAQLNGFFLQ
jgi:predicted extracellular nuclease